jgi:hypothetical protein
MMHNQRSFGRRAADISPAQRQARQVATRCGGAALFFAGLTMGAGQGDNPGAVLIAFLGAVGALAIAVAATSEA